MRKVRINKKLFLLILCALAFLQGCALFKSFSKEEDKKEALAVKQETLLVELGGMIGKGFITGGKKRKVIPLASFINKAWLGDEVDFFTKGQNDLPHLVKRFHELVFISKALRLEQIADQLSAIISLPVQVIGGKVSKVALVQFSDIRYRGPLKGFLDLLAANFEASWSYDRRSKSIIFTRVLTRQFNFHSMAGSNYFTTKISSGDNFSASKKIKLDPWKEIKQNLIKVLPKGSQVGLSEMMGKITIMTTPKAMVEAVRLLRQRNRDLQRQIYFNIQLIELDISEHVLKAQGRLPVSLAGLLRQASQGKLKVNGQQGRTKKTKEKGGKEKGKKKQKLKTVEPANSLDLVVKTLARIGKLSVLASVNSRTSNGKSFPVRATSDRSYRSNIKRSVDPDTKKVLTSTTPAETQTGFYMNLRPLILSHDRVQLDLSIALKSLSGLKKYAQKEGDLSVPQIDTKSWTQEMIVPSDATILLSGFESRQTAVGSHIITMLLITPQILDNGDIAGGI